MRVGRKTKIVDYIDPETNVKAKVLLPVETPDEFAAEGVLISLSLSELYPEPIASKVQEALWARGLTTWDEVYATPGALNLIRQAVQQVYKVDANDIYNYGRSKQHVRD